MDIRLLNLTKSFDGKTVFQNLNLTFPEGRISCLMGASGSGKTTILHLIMGLLKPDSGVITGNQGRRIAAVFQEDRLIEHWDALKNIRLVCEKGVTADQICQELHNIGIDDVQNKPVRGFSGGMRRRVAFVRALLAEGNLLILDEPFKGLDEERKKQVISYMKKRTEGKTVIVVTHDKTEAELLGADLISME
jgi:NitT/TauT family transport system ATP-binding protein